jgi:hypothetical protein
MAELVNDAGALRFRLVLADREKSGRVLGSVALEYLDRRDRTFWPLVRLPVVHLSKLALDELRAEIRAFTSGASPGFAWRPGEGDPVALQLGGAEGDAITVEVGFDIGLFLEEAAGVPRRPGAELALFRFAVPLSSLLRFSEALRVEEEELER